MTHVLGIDVGGSGTRGILARVGPGGPVAVARAAVEVANRVDPSGLVVDDVAGNIARVISGLLHGHTGRVAAAAVGCTGLTHQGERVREQLPARLAGLCGAGVVVLSSDTLTSYLGGLGWRPGAVVAVGTGAVAVGSDMRGQWRRVDGWGYNVGDVGGGSWIGRRGLDAGLRAFDGRSGGSPALLDRLLARFGSPVVLAGQLARRDDRAAVLAGFAPDVLDAADDGDGRSQDIVVEAGRHLADAAVAALPAGCDRVTAMGALVVASRRLSASFAEHVPQFRPGVDVTTPAGTGCDGAVLLAAGALEDGLPPGSGVLGAQLTRHG